MGVVMAVVAGTTVGCSSPQERYRVLSFFFDGVPDPDAPKPGKALDEEEEAANAKVVTASVLTIHKPYKERQCDVCHRAANGDIQEFEKAYDGCLKCHEKVPTGRKLMHGPVAREACRFCHEAHESNQPALLRDTPRKVCMQCHDSALLSNFPPQHVDGETSCLSCHYGHGGDARNYLKPDQAIAPQSDSDVPQGAWPSINPGSTPATQPATQPAPPLRLQSEREIGRSAEMVLTAMSPGEAGSLAREGWRHDVRAPAAPERGP